MQSPERAVPKEAEALIVCSKCNLAKRGDAFDPTRAADVCSGCVMKQAESDYWADRRAQGKAAFVRYNSGNGIPFSRGKAVMTCLNCEALLVGEKTILQHAKRCRRK